MPKFKYEFGAKQGDPVRWWQWTLALWGYPQSLEVHIFNPNFMLYLVLQWHPRLEIGTCRRYKWQPVWFRITLGLFLSALTIDLWLPIWLLKQKPITMTEYMSQEPTTGTHYYQTRESADE